MTRAGTALAAVLAAVALAAGCTAEAEPDPPVPTDDRPFGPEPDFEEHATSLMTASSDKDIETLCADLETALTEGGLVLHMSEAAEDWCGHSVDTVEPAGAAERAASGVGAGVPVRLHAWDDGDATQVAYYDPAPMLVAVDAEDESLAEQGTALAAALSAAVTEATGGEPEAGDAAGATYTEINSEIPADELADALGAAAESAGLQPYGWLHYEADGATLVVTYPVEGISPLTPEAHLASRVNLHVWADGSGNGVISYFDPMPLLGAMGEEFGDAGMTLSGVISEVAWEAALPQ